MVSFIKKMKKDNSWVVVHPAIYFYLNLRAVHSPFDLYTNKTIGKAIGLDENAKVVFILNYVLDSLPCDVINVKRSKESREAWIGVVPKESSSVSGLHMRRLDPVPNVLCQFLKRFHCEEEQWMLWPTNALRALRTLRESNVGNKVFIIGDKMVDTMDASNWAETIPGFDKLSDL